MNITVIGATGYIGQALIDKLLSETTYNVIGFSKSAGSLARNSQRFTGVSGDIYDTARLTSVLKGCDAAIYLVHMMGVKYDNYSALEARAARLFGRVAHQAGVGRVIYLGGLGDDAAQLSKHLSSRQQTGAILRELLPVVLEFRASMIIGNGSVGYEIVKSIASKLPVIAIPRWANTTSQPIGLQDTLTYLVAAIKLPTTQLEIIEIGGPEALTYQQIMERYTAWSGRQRRAYIVRHVPAWALKLWFTCFTSKKTAAIGSAMIESLRHDMIINSDVAENLFPAIKPSPIEAVFI